MNVDTKTKVLIEAEFAAEVARPAFNIGKVKKTGDEFADAYGFFGLHKGATDNQIKTEYKKRVRQFHPDVTVRGDPFAANKKDIFNRIVGYKNILLKDSERRKAYDLGGVVAVKAYDNAGGKISAFTAATFPEVKLSVFKPTVFKSSIHVDPFVRATGRSILSRKKQEKFKFDPNSTENEGRWRLKDPKNFIGKFTRVKSTSSPGVSYVIGKSKVSKTWEVQAVRFDKSKFDEQKAARWWKKNKNRFRREWVWTK